MSGDPKKQKVVVVGAGPVGSLAALYAAARGDDVEVYELRGGMYRLAIELSHFSKRKATLNIFPFFQYSPLLVKDQACIALGLPTQRELANHSCRISSFSFPFARRNSY